LSNQETVGNARSQPWRPWLTRVLIESLFIIFSVLFALALDQWQEERGRNRRAQIALQSIQAELEENRESIQRARSNHVRLRDSLQSYVEKRQHPPTEIYLGGVFNPGLTHSTAWEAARETGATSDLPYPLVLALSRVYDRQARYRALGDAVVQDLMMQVRREGFEPVLRDRPANLMALQEDFANRELALGQAYDAVLAKLNDLSRRP
jgi:type II secretory pathway pseudopilin PulG